MKIPHKATILIRAEVHPLRTDGYIDAKVVSQHKKLYEISGNSKKECENKLLQLIEKVNEYVKQA